ncbi:MAG: hypothetical protein AAFP97_11330 [Pseudomonadota bacterium]
MSERTAKIVIIAGVTLLLLMAGLHISGVGLVTDRMAQSDAPDFLKSIFPVLFISASLQLVALAAFGGAALKYPVARRGLSSLVALFALINAGFALFLAHWVPAGILGLATVCFSLVALKGQSSPDTEP